MLAIENNAAMKEGVHMSFQTVVWDSSDKYLKVGLLVVNFLRSLILFPIVAVPL